MCSQDLRNVKGTFLGMSESRKDITSGAETADPACHAVLACDMRRRIHASQMGLKHLTQRAMRLPKANLNLKYVPLGDDSFPGCTIT
jgi:hypothetical protein